MRDRALEATVRDLLKYDERLQGLAVEVRVDGGVAHADGWVPSPECRTRLREALVALRGIYAVWDGVLVGNQQRLRILDVGCGRTKQKLGALGVDLFPVPGVGVVADVRAGLPFRDASVDRIYAVHVLEHVVDVVPVMNELHRVLLPGGVLHVMSPHWQAIGAVRPDARAVLGLCVLVRRRVRARRPRAGAEPGRAGHRGAARPLLRLKSKVTPRGGRRVGVRRPAPGPP